MYKPPQADPETKTGVALPPIIFLFIISALVRNAESAQCSSKRYQLRRLFQVTEFF